MKLMIALLAVVFPLTSFAALDIKPGLWTTKMTIELNGQKIDAMGMMNAAMAMMSEDQKKQVADMLAKQGHKIPEMDKDGAKTCLTKEMLQKPSSVTETKECKTTITNQTSTKITGNFKCTEPEASGTFEWTAKSQTSYEAVMKGKTPDAKNIIMRGEGKFVSPDCGKHKS